MAMTKLEAYLFGAFAAQNRWSANIAVGLDSNNNYLAIAKEDKRSQRDYRTAIVNLLQNNDTINIAKIIVTSKPDEIDAGMSRMRQVKEIMFIEANQFRKINPQNDNPLATTSPVVGDLISTLPKDPDIFTINENSRARSADIWLSKNSSAIGIAGFKQIKDWRNIPINASIKVEKLTNPVAPLYPPGRTDTQLRHKIFNNLAYAILDVTNRVRKSYPDSAIVSQGRPIGSIIVDPDDQIVGWGINSFNKNKTLHGETNAIMNYFRKQSRQDMDNHRIYTTLEPCHMCAAVIANSGIGIEVYYGADDPKISNSALDRNINGCTQKEFFGTSGAKLRLQQNLLANHKTTNIRSGRAYTKTDGEVRAVTSFLKTPEAENIIDEYYQKYMNMRTECETDADEVCWKQGSDLLLKIMETRTSSEEIVA